MFESQDPPKSEDHLRWTTLKLFPGRKLKGWAAGPALGFITHHTKVSKPCRLAITGGQVSCNWCDGRIRKGWTGYQPLISEEGDRMVALYGKDFHAQVKAIEYGRAIIVRKANCPNGVVSVAPSDWTTMSCPWLSKRRFQADIRPWLLRLWKDEELIKFFGSASTEIPVIQNDDDICPQLRNRLIDQPLISDLLAKRETDTKAELPIPSKNGHPKEVKKRDK